ncbi:MAG: peptide-methionine (S)-S-oxide reductase MsrA [Planctomycetota bacterium]
MYTALQSLCVSGAILLAGFYGCEKPEIPRVSEQNQNTESKVENEAAKSRQQYPVATFAGGCFWGTEHVFGQVPGVRATAVGFMGGQTRNPSYKRVCTTNTNHAEVVQLRYDPEQISYEKLVKIFFKTHNPTTLNRQGPDVGTQYRSAIFYHDESQKQTAEKVKAAFDASGEFNNPIVTGITRADTFWEAEAAHQDYFKKNPKHPACHAVDINEIKKILNEN